MNNDFDIVGIKEIKTEPVQSRQKAKGFPYISAFLMCVIVLGCVFCNLIITKDPLYLDLENCSTAPNTEFIFGTDTLGRDIFSMIWYGGRISLFIGFMSTMISTVFSVIFGSLSALAPNWLDNLMMRFCEIFLSIPSILLIIFFQALFSKPNVLSICAVIGLTSWASIAKVVRTQVKQMRNSEYIIASKAMGGGFFHILQKHIAPNLVPSIMFMVVMNIRNAIVAESTLSFIGLGLPIGIVSWGSMLSLSQNAFLTKAWWIILIPGLFLISTLMSITNLGNYLREKMNKKQSNL